MVRQLAGPSLYQPEVKVVGVQPEQGWPAFHHGIYQLSTF
jgi:hypothetical protein